VTRRGRASRPEALASPHVSQTIELPGTRPAGPDDANLGGAWRVIVKNDDHNTFDYVARTLARYIPGMTLDQGYGVADRIHQTGQAIVWSGHQELAEHYWAQLSDAGLTMAPLERG
jgi:ATP-dependent Clp protease adaptor protein ClpS